MDDKKARIAAARSKLKNKFKGSARLGGKGTQRRKKKVTHKSGSSDTKLKNVLKKFGAEVIPEIAEVNMFTEDDKVLTFRAPEVRGSIRNHTLIVTGSPDERDLMDCFTEIMPQLGPEQLAKLKNVAPTAAKPEQLDKIDDAEEVPDDVGDFEDAVDGGDE